MTDHKPLLGLIREDRATSLQDSVRIKHWSLFLSTYEYNLVFRDTKAHANADALSRFPLPVEPAKVDTPPEIVLLAEHLVDSPVKVDWGDFGCRVNLGHPSPVQWRRRAAISNFIHRLSKSYSPH